MLFPTEITLPEHDPEDFFIFTGLIHPLYEEINRHLKMRPAISLVKADELFPQMELEGILVDFLNNEHANAYYHGLYKRYTPYEIIMAIEYQHQKDDLQNLASQLARQGCKDRLISRRSNQQRKRR